MMCYYLNVHFHVQRVNGNDTLRRHLYIMLDRPVSRGCEAQEWTSPHILSSVRHTSDTEFLFLGPSGYQKSKSGENLELIKGTGLPWLELKSSVEQRACERPACNTTTRARTHYLFYSFYPPYPDASSSFNFGSSVLWYEGSCLILLKIKLTYTTC